VGEKPELPVHSSDCHVGAETDDHEHSLLVSGGLVDGTADVLLQEQLDAIVLAAKQQWIDSGLVPEGSLLLDTITFTITDLEGGKLGEADGTTVWVDATAAGYGWFVDTTPYDNAEFDGAAPAGVDLLTVVLHEIGHILGYGHDSGLAVMEDTLAAGSRVLLGGSGETADAGDEAVAGTLTTTIDTLTGEADDTSLVFTIKDLDSDNSLDVSVTGSNGDDGEYTDISNLNGGAASNVEIVIDSSITASATWTITGDGAGTLTVNGFNTINFTNIDVFTGAAGGSGSDTLIGPGLGSIWKIDGANAGNVAGISYSGIENLLGGIGIDHFVFTADGSLSGSITGSGGNDRIRGGDKGNQWHINGNNSGKLNNGNFSGIQYLEGGNDKDEFVLFDGGSLAGGLDGQEGDDTVVGADTENTWSVTAAAAGTVNSLAFSAIENLSGGLLSDIFVFAGGSVASSSGGGGSDTLDFFADAAGVVVELAAGTATYAGSVSEIEILVVRRFEWPRLQRVRGAHRRSGYRRPGWC
jgi:hypothetical protein